MALASSASRLCLSLIMAAKDALQASSQTCSWSLPSSFPDNTYAGTPLMRVSGAATIRRPHAAGFHGGPSHASLQAGSAASKLREVLRQHLQPGLPVSSVEICRDRVRPLKVKVDQTALTGFALELI